MAPKKKRKKRKNKAKNRAGAKKDAKKRPKKKTKEKKKKCPCPTMVIQINNTSKTKDDLVPLKCTHPSSRTNVDCRIRVKKKTTQDTNVVLTNPDGRLRFPGPGDTTKSLTLPKDGSWVSFQISGEALSKKLGDAVIKAHCNSATGPLGTKKKVTVFWFDKAQTKITRGGNYAITGGRFTVTGGNAVNLSAKARIRPAGVKCSAPQVSNLKVGIMQNTYPPRLRTINWGTPAITWNAGVAAGTTVTVPTVMRFTIRVNVTANDSESSVAPLYDQPGKAGRLDANSLKPPIGCRGGGAATSHDTPSIGCPATYRIPAQTGAGVTVGTVTYNFQNVTHRDNFKTWTVIFNTSTNRFCVLRERIWTTNMDSAAAGPQRPNVAASDNAPTSMPVTAPPFSNTVSNDPANQSTGPGGPARTIFTK